MFLMIDIPTMNYLMLEDCGEILSLPYSKVLECLDGNAPLLLHAM